MILTVTLNPSVDISYQFDKFMLNRVNRVTKVSKTAGGKGLNVTRVLDILGDEVVATGFLGGEFGVFINNILDESGVEVSFQEIKGNTRNCIAILHEGMQTEILESGPVISENEQIAYIENFENLMDKIDLITMSGSLPSGVPDNFYSYLVTIANKANKKVLLDTSGPALEEAIKSGEKPYLIKPNLGELGELLNKSVSTNMEFMKEALKSELFDGIEWVVVSMGGDGAFVKHSEDFYKVNIPSIEVVNPVGSGDATVAGLAHGIIKNLSTEDILKTAMTAGMLNTMEETTGYINMNYFDSLIDQVEVVKVT